jgi:hypothetical protein
MIDRIGRAIAAADNGDFEADKARYRGLASVAERGGGGRSCGSGLGVVAGLVGEVERAAAEKSWSHIFGLPDGFGTDHGA